MGNIYIETDENFRITKIHRMPFDPTNGMGYTKEELEKKGFFVDVVPEPVNQTGRRAIAMYNPDTKSVYYEYVSTPLSDKERIDSMENAFNAFMARNAIYGTSTTSLEEDETEENPGDVAIATYLANQIIVSKLDHKEVIQNFPQFETIIKRVLEENGIQL